MKTRKKIVSLIAAVMLVAGMIPASVCAEEPEAAIQLGASQITGGQTDSVYYGNYAQSDSTGTTKDPIKWRVLSNNSNDAQAQNKQLFLLADQNLDVQPYNSSYTSVTWETCSLRTWLNDTFLNAAFSTDEQEEIAMTEVVNSNNPGTGTNGGNDTSDKIFLLSIEEALKTDYGFSNINSTTGDSSGRVSTNTAYVAVQNGMMSSAGQAEFWWLRSPGFYDYLAANVTSSGFLERPGNSVDGYSLAVRPAFNLNLESVLFTSAAEGGKSSGDAGAGNLTSVSNGSDVTEWKLTLKDDGRNLFSVDNDVVKISSKLIVSYSNAKTGDNEYISAMICDSAGNGKYYGRVKALTSSEDASGTAKISLAGVTMNEGDKLYVFNEQYNDDKKTDYSSDLKEVNIPANVNAYDVETSLTNLTFSGNDYAKTSEDYTATLKAEENYALPENITVKVGNAELTAGDNTYSYNSGSGVITIKSSAIKGKITITATAALPKENTPNAQIDYGNENLTDLTAGTYTISWDENQSGEYTLASGETTIAINDNWFGKELSIVRKGTENTTRDSDAQSLAVPSRPDAPSVGKTDETVDGNNDGAITGTSTTMEYRMKAAESEQENDWIACAGTSVTGLAPGTYEVRTKVVTEGDSKAFASKTAEVTIGKGKAREYNISVGNVTFDEAAYGYTQPFAETVTITNNGNVSTTVTGVTITGDNAESFTLSRTGGATGDVAIGTGSGNNTDTSYTIQPDSGLSPGEYKTTIQVTYQKDGGDTATANASVTFTVKKAESSVTITTESMDTTYSGNAVTEPGYTNTGSTGDVTITWYENNGTEEKPDWQSVESAPKDAGDYKVEVSVAGDGNYNGASAEKTFTISQATNEWTKALSISGWTYGQNANTPAAIAKFGEVSFTYSNQKDGDYTNKAPTNAGDWYVKATVESTANYTGLTAVKSFTIAKATPKDSDFTFTAPTNLAYDGKKKTATVEIAEGVSGMGKVTVRYYDSDGIELDGAPTEPGSYTVSIDVSEGDNYQAEENISAESWNFAIEKVKDPAVPSEPTGQDNKGASNATGDDSNLALYSLLAMISVAGIVGAVVIRKRKES